MEMLTGRPVFAGETLSQVLAAVLTMEPDWASLPPDVPSDVERLPRRCLEKNRNQRLDFATAARLDIEEADEPFPRDDVAASTRVTRLGVAVDRTPRDRGGPAFHGWSGLASRSGRSDAVPTPLYATLNAPPDFVIGEDDPTAKLPMRVPMVFTPDGASLIILASKAGRSELLLRRLDEPQERPILGIEGAMAPFVSPDGRWVGFFAGQELRKVPLEGPHGHLPSRIRLGTSGRQLDHPRRHPVWRLLWSDSASPGGGGGPHGCRHDIPGCTRSVSLAYSCMIHSVVRNLRRPT